MVRQEAGLPPSCVGSNKPLWRVCRCVTAVSFLQSLSQRYQTQISSAVRGENVGGGLGLPLDAGGNLSNRCVSSLVAPDEVSRVLPSLVMVDRASPRPKVAAHVTGSFAPKLEQDAGGGGESRRTSG